VRLGQIVVRDISKTTLRRPSLTARSRRLAQICRSPSSCGIWRKRIRF
jgi:hypothetical protein